jgi:hypothetical protein
VRLKADVEVFLDHGDVAGDGVFARRPLFLRRIGKVEVVDQLGAALAQRVDARGVHAAVEQRQRPVGPHPKPLAPVEQALARWCGHADQVVVGGGFKVLELDGLEEARVDAGDVVALHEVVRVDLPVGIERHAPFSHAGKVLDGFCGQFRHGVAQLRRQWS